jgi:hypothetical protein
VTRLRITIAALILAAIGISAMTPEPATDHPPHARPAESGWTLAPVTEAGYSPAWEWHEPEGTQREEEPLIVEAPVEHMAGEPPVRSDVGSTVGGDCAALAAELGLPEAVLWRESRCSRDAYNPGGCGGRGCVGAAQLDQGHFAPVSPWNSNASGSCAGLNPDDPGQYAECVGRLSAGGTNLSPWRA